MPRPPALGPDPGMVEVADRVWVTRSGTYDEVATVVAGASGVLLVDAGSSAAARRDLLASVALLGRGDPVAVVASHVHAGRALGAASDLDHRVPVLHEGAAAELPDRVGRVHPFSSVTAVDLGDRVAEVLHPGRGHTAGDAVVRVPDADVLVVGDLVAGDVAAGGSGPSYGPDCWPLEWPASLDLVLQLLGASGVAVPRHGAPLDRGAVAEQRDGIATVAETVRELAGRGVPVDRALAQGEADGSWPWPADRLSHAVRRGYAQLPPAARRLPLA